MCRTDRFEESIVPPVSGSPSDGNQGEPETEFVKDWGEIPSMRVSGSYAEEQHCDREEDKIEVVVLAKHDKIVEFLKKKCNAGITKLRLENCGYIDIDYSTLLRYDLELADLVLYDIGRCTEYFRDALRVVTGMAASNADIRFTGMKCALIDISRLKADKINKLVTVECVVTSVTDTRPEISTAVFRCVGCGYNYTMIQDSTKLRTPPIKCPQCGNSRQTDWDIVPGKSKFKDIQRLKLQERPGTYDSKRNPKSVEAKLQNSNVDVVTAGTRCIVTGKLMPLADTKSSLVFNTYIDVVSVELDASDESIVITDEDIQKIKELASRSDIFSILRNELAPSVYGYNSIKDAIVLQLFGGVVKFTPEGERMRGDSHILLIGDPGVAKSHLIRAASKIAKRSVYTSGKSTTSAGLTAAAIKDDLNDGGWTLEAGALVLGDGGMVAIDELDKMRPEDRSALHEAMEQQTVSINKAGISAVLNTRCSLLGAANPKSGKFDTYIDITQQINMPPSLLSRFDLLFIIQDTPDEKRDRAVADKIIDNHMQYGNPATPLPDTLLPRDLYRKYVSYARDNCKPVITPEIKHHASDFYIQMRKKAGVGIPITPRQFEAIIRLSEASAKVRLSDYVEEEDIARAVSLLVESLKQVSTDMTTGELDTSIIMTGVSGRKRNQMRGVLGIISRLGEDTLGVADEETVVTELMKTMTETEAREVIEGMKKSNMVIAPRKGKIRVV